ncbi:S41 family peptidase [Duncaniella muris]|jgi:carboxyl-terminal processing protease|uniref:S41 family peptidase n=1 Tax=Duncaniella muris TaxID=2094150 RepID=UPI0026744057|nr:S41 family peptidase [Duncaniella muris]
MKKLFFSSILLLAVCLTSVGQIEFTPERKLRYAEQIIESYYVDRIDTAKVVTEAIVAMLKTLDPHSTYSSPEETRELTEPLDGNFSGIGIRFQMNNDTLYVIESVAGGPSEKVGILPGDRIISCNDTVISGVKMKNNDIMKVLRGPKGTIAALKVLRKGNPQLLEFRVERDNIPIYSVEATYMINDSVGYISVSRFAEATAEEVAEAMGKLKKKGMRHLILDLTDNGGGYMRPATDISDMFLRRGDLVVYTESPKNGTAEYITQKNGSFLDGRVVVMVNQYSASASEILSGALQDNDRAVIVGRRTFGKGLVQRPFPFPDGSMMRLTVSRYHTPSGRCIQKPYVDGDDESYQLDMINRYNSGEFTNADSIHHFADSLLFHTRRLKRPVYGGGGIMPDRFVPIDTTMYSTYYRDLIAKGAVNNFTVDYVDANRSKIKSAYPTEESYIAGFTVTPEIMQGLIDRGTADGVTYDEAQFRRSEPILRAIVKGLVGRDLYDQSVYSRVVSPLDPTFAAAVEIINSPALYNSYLTPKE